MSDDYSDMTTSTIPVSTERTTDMSAWLLYLTRLVLLAVEVVFTVGHMMFATLRACLYAICPALAPVRFDLKDKWVLLTGSAGGLGQELAMEFVHTGANLVLLDRDIIRNQTVYKRVIASLGPGNESRCRRYVCDLSQRSEVADAVKGIQRDLGGVIDVIVNNAGVVSDGLVHEVADNVFMKTINTNFMSHFWLLKAFLPGMIDRDCGHVVTIGSIAGTVPVAQLSGYCASKAAAAALIDSVAADLRKLNARGVGTTLVLPGHIDTDLFRGIFIRFPALTPTMTPSAVAKRVVEGVQRRERVIYMPGRFHLAAILKATLAPPAFAVMHEFLKTQHGMDAFQGKKML